MTAKKITTDKAVLYLIHCQDANSRALANVSIQVKSPNGDWSSVTNACGDVIDPGSGLAGVTLKAGHYSAMFYQDGKQLELLYTDTPLNSLEWDLALPPEKPILVGLKSQAGIFPAIPTREQICAIQTSLQGLTYHTKQYGNIPAWFYAGLNEEDRAIARQDHKNQGDTHVHISISAAYKQEGTLWPAELREGYDFTQNLEGLRAILIETICDGLLIDMPLAGDGLGIGPGYNDPVGHTYGHGWLVNNLERIIRGLQGDGSSQTTTGDLTPYIIFRPGWDAVFYGWGGEESAQMSATQQKAQYNLRWRLARARLGEIPEPTPMSAQALDDQQKRIKDFGLQFRSILPNGYLALEHTPGNIPVGLGPSDYDRDGLMSTYDTLMGEFATVHENSFWQVLARMQRPFYRPADMPANNPDGTPNDPNPPHYTAQGTPRGPYFYIAYEPTTGGVYEWCRGRCSLEDVKQVDSYMRSCGALYTGFTQ